MRNARPGPFSLNVRDIERRPGQMREHTLDVALAERWGEGMVSIDSDELVEIDVRLESVHEGILATGTAAATAHGECGRCLAPVEESLEIQFQELFAYPGSEASDYEVQDDHVDLETLVRDALVLSLPFQPVCRPDCPGLDPETGEPLADRRDASEQANIDPRWAALVELAGRPEGSEDNQN